MINQGNDLTAVLSDIESIRLGEKEGRKNIVTEEEYHNKNKSEHKHIRDDRDR